MGSLGGSGVKSLTPGRSQGREVGPIGGCGIYHANTPQLSCFMVFHCFYCFMGQTTTFGSSLASNPQKLLGVPGLLRLLCLLVSIARIK